MNLTYQTLSKQQQEEIENFPMGFAFNNDQFEDVLAHLNTTKENIVAIGGGGYVDKQEASNLINMFKRHEKEMNQAMQDKDFARDAFNFELANHEYAISGDPYPALHALKLNKSDIQNNPILKEAFELALNDSLI